MIEQLKEDKQMVVALNFDLTTKINELMKEKESSLRKSAKFSQEMEELKDEFAQRMRLMKDELKEVERGGTIQLKKSGDEYVVVTSPPAEESSSNKDLIKLKRKFETLEFG
ncbi:hypothetical protein LWI29_038062 [Acer saccharum]|uniref:Uncharacterized protein n=1 Tax=Acer saccharum TaxID=4024 RepID=A0AA39RYD7_ACESA|nr:hypothetical protein LWI29_016972 [Acer saccharum]KAK0586021.1 hypothetical protein LWI29_038062 [Acer saccharum]